MRGKNFAVLEYTNTSCDVYGFSGTSNLTDVPIVSGATAWNDENGTTFILVIHHALWMGSKLKDSLINTNQLRFNGVRVVDDPTQDGLGIYAKDIHVELKMRDIVCFTNTRVLPAPKVGTLTMCTAPLMKTILFNLDIFIRLRKPILVGFCLLMVVINESCLISIYNQ